MRNKGKLLFVVVFLLILSGCQLAKSEPMSSQDDGRLAGIFVTNEPLEEAIVEVDVFEAMSFNHEKGIGAANLSRDYSGDTYTGIFDTNGILTYNDTFQVISGTDTIKTKVYAYEIILKAEENTKAIVYVNYVYQREDHSVYIKKSHTGLEVDLSQESSFETGVGYMETVKISTLQGTEYDLIDITCDFKVTYPVIDQTIHQLGETYNTIESSVYEGENWTISKMNKDIEFIRKECVRLDFNGEKIVHSTMYNDEEIATFLIDHGWYYETLSRLIE